MYDVPVENMLKCSKYMDEGKAGDPLTVLSVSSFKKPHPKQYFEGQEYSRVIDLETNKTRLISILSKPIKVVTVVIVVVVFVKKY